MGNTRDTPGDVQPLLAEENSGKQEDGNSIRGLYRNETGGYVRNAAALPQNSRNQRCSCRGCHTWPTFCRLQSPCPFGLCLFFTRIPRSSPSLSSVITVWAPCIPSILCVIDGSQTHEPLRPDALAANNAMSARLIDDHANFGIELRNPEW